MMFAPLLAAVRADVDRQIGWAKDEVRRQTRHSILIAALALVAALAALGAVVIGIIALYVWLAMRTDPLTALAVIGGGFVLVALILIVVLALVSRRPRVAPRPPLQSAQPAALFGMLAQGGPDRAMAASEQLLNAATANLRHGSRSALFGTLVLVVVAGMIAGRRL
jgi:hypothetical protein